MRNYPYQKAISYIKTFTDYTGIKECHNLPYIRGLINCSAFSYSEILCGLKLISDVKNQKNAYKVVLIVRNNLNIYFKIPLLLRDLKCQLYKKLRYKNVYICRFKNVTIDCYWVLRNLLIF